MAQLMLKENCLIYNDILILPNAFTLKKLLFNCGMNSLFLKKPICSTNIY